MGQGMGIYVLKIIIRFWEFMKWWKLKEKGESDLHDQDQKL